MKRKRRFKRRRMKGGSAAPRLFGLLGVRESLLLCGSVLDLIL